MPNTEDTHDPNRLISYDDIDWDRYRELYVVEIGTPGNTELIGPFETEKDADEERVRMVHRLDQRTTVAVTAEVRLLKNTETFYVEWA